MMASTPADSSETDAPVSISQLSVIVPTHGRVHLVEKMLESLSQARKCTGADVQVIVVDSSGPEDMRAIASACTQYDALHIRGPLSVRRKRNMGVASASAPFVLFLDSDCQVDEQLLNEHIQAWQKRDGKVVGFTGLTRFVGKESLFWRVMERTPFLDAFSFAERFPGVQWAITNNLSVSKDLFLQIGGFDERLPYRLGWDDIDLGLRFTSAGYYIRSLPAARVYHEKETWNSLGSQISRLWRWGRLRFWMLCKHPSLQCYDPVKPSTVFLMAALLFFLACGIEQKLTPLLLILAWLPVSCLAVAIVRVLFRRKTITEIPLEWAAEGLLTFHDLATLYESLRQGSPLWITHRLIFHQSQLESDFPAELERFWGLSLTFLLAGFIAWRF